LKETCKVWGAPLAQGHDNFSSGCNYVMGYGKSQLPANFEVASFSFCRNIKEKPQILGSFPSPGPRPLFFWMGFDDGP